MKLSADKTVVAGPPNAPETEAVYITDPDTGDRITVVVAPREIGTYIRFGNAYSLTVDQAGLIALTDLLQKPLQQGFFPSQPTGAFFPTVPDTFKKYRREKRREDNDNTIRE